jgi:hypothetical protein
MPSHPEFREATPTEPRFAHCAPAPRVNPDNPGLIGSWPGVREDRMAAACAELLSRGDPLFRISIRSANPAGPAGAGRSAARIDE